MGTNVYFRFFRIFSFCAGHFKSVRNQVQIDLLYNCMLYNVLQRGMPVIFHI